MAGISLVADLHGVVNADNLRPQALGPSAAQTSKPPTRSRESASCATAKVAAPAVEIDSLPFPPQQAGWLCRYPLPYNSREPNEFADSICVFGCRTRRLRGFPWRPTAAPPSRSFCILCPRLAGAQETSPSTEGGLKEPTSGCTGCPRRGNDNETSTPYNSRGEP